jgi:hypothetical protein
MIVARMLEEHPAVGVPREFEFHDLAARQMAASGDLLALRWRAEA